ncbi:MAG: SDR family oxidoreductase [Acidobacteriota bacterium]
MMMEGRVAIVTGGAAGIGYASARKLCELGASVAVLDRDPKAGEASVAALVGSGFIASYFPCDISIESQVQSAIAATVARYGGLHILVSNAGIQTNGDVVTTTPEVWDETMNIHVKGCFYATKYAIPAITKCGGGAIVIVSSVQSFTAVNNSAAYVAAKHALLGITRAIALDFASRNIRANCVCPGAIDTPMLRATADRTGAPEEMLASVGRMHALGRIGVPEEVANAVAFLASDDASFITGTSLIVDGGLLVPTGGMGFQESGIGTGGKE